MADDDKVFDVAKPGETEASATSKPVITGHKVMLSDPMMKQDAGVEADVAMSPKQELKISIEPEDKQSGSPAPSEPDSANKLANATTKNIMPLNADLKTSEDKKENEAKEPVKLQINVDNEQSAPSSQKEDKLKDSTPQQPKTSEIKPPESIKADPQTTDSMSSEAFSKAEAQKKDTEQAQKSEAYKKSMEELAVSKKYHVPIGQKTRQKRFIVLILAVAVILMLVVLFIYFMM